MVFIDVLRQLYFWWTPTWHVTINLTYGEQWHEWRYSDILRKAVSQEAIPADDPPARGCERGKRSDPRQDPHWAPLDILGAIPPPPHTS